MNHFKLTLSILALLFSCRLMADPATDSLIKATIIQDSIVSSLHYQTGTIEIGDKLAKVNVPNGYKFLNGKQSQYVLEKLWGNPEDASILGMLIPEAITPLDDSFSYAVVLSYSEEGYIKDDDAKDIDYDDLLEQMQKDMEAENADRVKNGYEDIKLVGWASAPFYDENTKKLHWAKELKFGESEINTLNYDIRILGRKGYLSMNAVGDMSVLPQFKNDVNTVLSSVEFTDGNKYSDFDPEIDKVAAYGIGALVAGKVLAKVGFFAVLLKFWKLIVIGIIAVGAAIKKFFIRKREPEMIEQGETEPTTEPGQSPDQPAA